MRIAIYTLGCKVNQSESSSIEGELREQGYEIVDFPRKNSPGGARPDACIINTCTVTAKSDYQSRQMIRRALRTGAEVIATGCYAQLRPGELSRIKGLRVILGNSEKPRLLEHIKGLSLKDKKEMRATVNSSEQPVVTVHTPDAPLRLQACYSTRTRAFLKIQEGCNSTCTYCTVPRARGKSRSLKDTDILRALERFSLQGYREVILTGIHIGSYGLDLQPKKTLSETVRRAASAYPHIRFRLSSLELCETTGEIIALLQDGAVCPHLHIPLQSGSDRVLQAMKRGYTAKDFQGLVNTIASSCPGTAIGTDVIVGFPGETEKDFSDTVSLLKGLPLAYLHVFPYSSRPDTVAAMMKGQVGADIKKERVQALLEVNRVKKNHYMKGYLGKYLHVIVEEKTKTKDYYRGISENYIRPFIRSNDLNLGQYMRVKAVSFVDENLFAIPSEETGNTI